MNLRSLHRDLGYLYVGLIISFATSGILMNHREHWHPEKYTVKVTEFNKLFVDKKSINEDNIKQFVSMELHLNDKVKRHFLKKDKLKITCENHDIELNLETGKGEMVEFIKTPVISQMMFIHKSNSNWWIYYSDIFALSLIAIALSGIFMFSKGKNTFKARGWKLAVAGLLVPIVFILIFA